jgi:structural maintenance of chromosome 1
MPVTYLELENFKSYAGLQKIGPFTSFTSIIGPNGSGKSNVMDALSFVLGVQSRDLRSSQMKDLIFRPPGNSKTNNNKLNASASLYFHNETTDETTKFQRSISSSGAGEYKIDDTAVTFKEYEQHLATIGVLVKARNFLVFQGDVESLARKTPAEFVTLLEQISQSIDLKKDYEQGLKEKEEAEAATLFCYNKQKGMKGERRILKEQKEEAERFHQLLEKRTKLQKDLYLWLLYHMDVDRKEREVRLEDLTKELQEKNELEQEQTLVLKAAKKKASAARRNTQAADKQRVALAAEVDKLEPSIIQATEQIKTFKKKIEQDQTQLKNKKKQAESHKDKLETLSKEIDESNETLEVLEKDYEEVKRDAAPDQVSLTQEQEEEYERVRDAAAAASVQPRRNLVSANKKLESSRARAADMTSELQEAKSRKAEVSREVQALNERTEKLSSVRFKNFVLCSVSLFVLWSSTFSHNQFIICLPACVFTF